MTRSWIDRALFFIRRRQESLAASDLGEPEPLYPGGLVSTGALGALVLFSGDREEYGRGAGNCLNDSVRPAAPIFERISPSPWAWVRTRSTITTTSSGSPRRRPTKSSSAPNVYHDLALICLRAGRFEAALRALDDLDRLLPGWPGRTLNDPVRAIVCYRLGRHAGAEFSAP